MNLNQASLALQTLAGLCLKKWTWFRDAILYCMDYEKNINGQLIFF